MRNDFQSKTCDEKPRFAPDRQNCDTEIGIVGDVWKPQHSWKKEIWQSPGVSHQLLGKRTQCRHSASGSWLGREVFFSKSEENFVKCSGTKNSQIDLSGYCSKQLGAEKSPKVGHAALPSHLKPKLDSFLVKAGHGWRRSPLRCQSQEPPRRKLDPLSQGCRGPLQW